MQMLSIFPRPLATIQDIMINVYLTTASRINFDIKEILVSQMLCWYIDIENGGHMGHCPPLFTNLWVKYLFSTYIVATFAIEDALNACPTPFFNVPKCW